MEKQDLVHIVDEIKKKFIINILIKFGLSEIDLKKKFQNFPELGKLNIITKYNFDASVLYLNNFEKKIIKLHTAKLCFLIINVKDVKVNDVIKEIEAENFFLISHRLSLAIFSNFSYSKINENLNLCSVINKEQFFLKYKDANRRYVSHFNSKMKVKDTYLVPQLFIHPNRFDVLIKLYYARLKKKNVAKKWRDFCYFQHIRHITGPTKKVREYDGTNKEGEQLFLKIFNKMIETSINNFPPVLVDNKNFILDGSHRASVALLQNSSMKIGKFDYEDKRDASYKFFSKKNGKNLKLNQSILNEAALEAIRVKKGLRIVLLFPSILSKKFANEYIQSNCDIIFSKSFLTNRSVGREILKEAYHGHSLIDTDSKLFEQKVNNCFIDKGSLTVLLIQNFDISSIIKIKKKIRDHYAIGNDSIHITDSEDELNRISKIIFNENSLEAINGNIMYDKRTYGLISDFREWVDINNYDPDDFVIGGSALLGLMGIRVINDLDFLTIDDYSKLSSYPENINDHVSQIKYYKTNIDDLIYNPKNYFWYMGVKFCSYDIILKMKQLRAEDKDLYDVKHLQEKYLKTKKISVVFKNFIYIEVVFKIYFRKLKRYVYSFIKKIKKFLNAKK